MSTKEEVELLCNKGFYRLKIDTQNRGSFWVYRDKETNEIIYESKNLKESNKDISLIEKEQ